MPNFREISELIDYRGKLLDAVNYQRRKKRVEEKAQLDRDTMVQVAIDKMTYLKSTIKGPKGQVPEPKLINTFGKGGDFREVKITANDEFSRPFSDLKS